jgi:two-component system, cell cycle response regulator DivK
MAKKILIIEDNEQNMYLMTFLLEKNGYTVNQARTGKEGIRLAREVQPDAILLDIQLPELDGYGVAKELRNNHSLKQVPIIAVTSYAMVGDKERILAAGATGYIEKPIDPNTFIQQLQEYMLSLPTDERT